ncbi:MAG: hypothetical protein HYV33_01140 [Candidatus Kerfeldbacteria bacterium]|nr:hypothetical protein [Candidatus Kerfeldbacteria bacterium]
MRDTEKVGHKKLVTAAIVFAVLFTAISVYSYLSPYAYFASSDTYRDYYTVQAYLIQNKQIDQDRLYSHQPLLYYYTTIVHRLTNISVFDLMRIVLPIIFSVSLLFFYLFYRELFKNEFIALTGAFMTVIGEQFFYELFQTRPQIFSLVICPLVLWAYCKLYKQPSSWITLSLLIALITALSLTHVFGVLVSIIVLGCLALRYLFTYKRYWQWISIGMLSIILYMITLGRNTLLASVTIMFLTIYNQNNTDLLDGIGLTLRNTLSYLGFFFTMIIAVGGIVLIIDRFRTSGRAVIPTLLILPSCLLFLFGLTMTWLGPVLGYAVILPTRMLVYLWIGAVPLLLYYLQRLPKKILRFSIIGCLLITTGFIKQDADITDLGYILGNETNVLQYITEHNITNSVILTQATSYPLFILLPSELNNVVISNRLFGTINAELDSSLTQRNTKLANEIFYADSAETAASAIEQLIALRSIDPTKPVYIAYSLVKSYNQQAWDSLGFRKQSLDGANLENFDDQKYFRLMFDNNDIKLWRYVPTD